MSSTALIEKLNDLISENQNPETLDIDLLNSIGVVKQINEQDKQVALAVEKELEPIAEAVDQIVNAFKNGGRLVYVGAGTSGRLGVLDAVECVPTFGVSDNKVVALMAGGESAMFKAKEGIEDDFEAGEDDAKEIELKNTDVLVGIAASGRTPYVIGALDYANRIGCKTIALSCNPKAEIADHAGVSILPVVGPEALTGSTRMKSGTAQKLVLNMLSTASMIRIGKSYKNLMVDVKATNKKLLARGIRMVMQVTGVEEKQAENVLRAADMQVKLAILMLLRNVSAQEGKQRLEKHEGFLRKAMENS